MTAVRPFPFQIENAENTTRQKPRLLNSTIHEVIDRLSAKHHARMPTFSRLTLACCGRAGTAPPALADDRVVPARGDGVFVAGPGFVEKATA